ncbi:unnamed protein product [Cercopithifilaria johnstoni]|uniref:SOCS box domain-containing protein n=1 Tax=Cercopithifilaria johnstoni TaxID=2874296 RepID=A0A8J2MJX7_9BILA|nr:unnamed protein product [Cercopithifilaria johnstoni]
MMKKFVEWGCNIFGFSWDGSTALMIAVNMNFYDGVEWLLNKAGDKAAELANIRTRDGQTSLLIAVNGGYAKILELLIKYGANCNVPNCNRMHPIALAALNKHPKCVELLLPHVNHDVLMVTDLDPVQAAASSQCYDSLTLLVNFGYSLEVPCYWEEGIEMPHLYTYPLIAREYCTPLYVATQNDNYAIVKFLIEAGAKMTYTSLYFSPFLVVLQDFRNFNILLQYLENDVDVNAISTDSTFNVPDALLVSLSSYKWYRLVILLSCGLDPMLKNWCRCKYGRSLLQDIIESPNIGNAKKLLKMLLYFSPFIPACCNEIANVIRTDITKVPKLCHLCRLAIRKLFPTSKLLYGRFVKDLPISQRMKDYLNFQNTTYSSFPPFFC